MDVHVMGILVGTCKDAMEVEWNEIAYGDFVASSEGKALNLPDCYGLTINFEAGTLSVQNGDGEAYGGKLDIKVLASLIEGDE